MKVNIIDSVMGLGLDRRTVGVLRLVSPDGETVSMSQLIKILHIMEYNDWERFDENIDSVVTITNKDVSLNDNLITITGPGQKSTQIPERSFKGYDFKGPTKKEIKTAGQKALNNEIKKLKNNTSDKPNRKYHSKEDIIKAVREYVDNHEYYYIENMAKELGFGHNSVRKYVKLVDPEGKKRGPHPATVYDKRKKNHKKVSKSNNRTELSYDEVTDAVKKYIDSVEDYSVHDIMNAVGVSGSAVRRRLVFLDPDKKKLRPNIRNTETHKNKVTIFNYMSLNNDEAKRKSWLDSTVSIYAKQKRISRNKIMEPVYKILRDTYGIVFIQEGKDYLYTHNFTPIDDYPLPTNYEVCILNENVFNTAKSLLIDRYGEVEV